MPILFTDSDGQRWRVWLRPADNRACDGKVGGLRRLKQKEADHFRNELGDEESARAIESLTLMQWLRYHGAIQRSERR